MELTSWKRIRLAAASEFRTHCKIFTIMIILIACGCLMMGLGYSSSSSTRRFYVNTNIYFGVFLYICSIAGGFILSLTVFKELHKIQTADVQMSLPLSSRERFLSKILTICYIQFLPLIAGNIVVIFLSLTGSAPVSTVITNTLLFIDEALFTDAITIFVVCCCGTLGESIYIALITIFCVSYMPYSFFSKIIEQFSGVNYSGAYKIFDYWTYSMSTGDSFSAHSVIVLIVSLILSSLLLFASMFIYQKRDGKSVGSPIVFKLFFECFMFIGLFSLLVLFSFSSAAGIGIMFALIIYIVIRIIVNRKSMNGINVLIWLGKFAATFAVFYIIVALGYITGGFGYQNFTPTYDSSTVYTSSKISISIRSTYPNSSIVSDNGSSNYSSSNTQWKNSIATNEQIIAATKAFNNYQSYKQRKISFANLNQALFSNNYYYDYYRYSSSVSSQSYCRVYISVTRNKADGSDDDFSISLYIDPNKYNDFCSDINSLGFMTNLSAQNNYTEDY